MNKCLLFTDASFSKELSLGVGAKLLLLEKELNSPEHWRVTTRVTPSTSIARLELETVLWALEEFKDKKKEIHLFTDCMAIEKLLKRRRKLEETDFQSKRSGKTLTNADLYKTFFSLCDEIKPSIQWIEGHTPAAHRSDYQKAFACVDETARRILRTELSLRK